MYLASYRRIRSPAWIGGDLDHNHDNPSTNSVLHKKIGTPEDVILPKEKGVICGRSGDPKKRPSQGYHPTLGEPMLNSKGEMAFNP